MSCDAPCPLCTLERDLCCPHVDGDNGADRRRSGCRGVLLGLYCVWGVECGSQQNDEALLLRLVDLYETRVLLPIRVLAGGARRGCSLSSDEVQSLVASYQVTPDTMRFHLTYHVVCWGMGYASMHDVERILSSRRSLPVT